MKIAICDDDNTLFPQLIHFIQSYPQNTPDSFSISAFTSEDEFLAAHGYFDILFMDIYFSNANGIDLVAGLNNKQYGCVVFLTTSREYAIEAFQLNASHYLVKPVTEEMVHTALQRCFLKLHSTEEPALKISVSSGIVTVPYRYIIYIEALNKRTVIHTDAQSYATYSSLDSISEQLDPDFFMRAQRSYIVHMGRITDFYSNYLLLENGIKISLSRKTQATLKKQYQDFLFRLTRRTL